MKAGFIPDARRFPANPASTAVPAEPGCTLSRSTIRPTTKSRGRDICDFRSTRETSVMPLPKLARHQVRSVMRRDQLATIRRAVNRRFTVGLSHQRARPVIARPGYPYLNSLMTCMRRPVRSNQFIRIERPANQGDSSSSWATIRAETVGVCEGKSNTHTPFTCFIAPCRALPRRISSDIARSSSMPQACAYDWAAANASSARSTIVRMI